MCLIQGTNNTFEAKGILNLQNSSQSEGKYICQSEVDILLYLRPKNAGFYGTVEKSGPIQARTQQKLKFFFFLIFYFEKNIPVLIFTIIILRYTGSSS